MKEKKIVSKLKAKINNQKQYKIFKSKQLLGLILLLVASFLFLVSIIQITGFTTIYAYSFGFIFGYYSYFLFIGFIYYGLSLLFNIDIKIEKYLVKKYNRVFNFSWLVYLFFVIGISLVVESSIIIYKSGTVFPGIKAFNLIIDNWWNSFISSNNAWLPQTQNQGILMSILIPSFSSWAGNPVSIFLGVVLVLYFVFYIYYGSIITILKNSKNEKYIKLKGEKLEEHKTKILDLTFEDKDVNENKEIQNNIFVEDKKTVTINVNDTDNFFPFDDPFNEENKSKDFIKDKTKEFNLKHNLTTEFDISKKEERTKSNQTNSQTFNFELDIFNTKTQPIEKEESF